MQKNSMASLSEKLSQQLEEDQRAVSNQTSKLLALHAESLRQLSNESLNTTKSVFQNHHQHLENLSAATLKKIRWLMVWPLIASLSISILILAAVIVWSMWKNNQTDNRIAKRMDTMQILEQEFCASPQGKKICVPRK